MMVEYWSYASENRGVPPLRLTSWLLFDPEICLSGDNENIQCLVTCSFESGTNQNVQGLLAIILSGLIFFL